MPNTGKTINPTSTVTVFEKELSFGSSPNEIRFALAAGGSVSFPIDMSTRPMRLSIMTNDGGGATYGIIQVFGTETGQCNVAGNNIATGTPLTAQLGFTLSNGVATFTAGATWAGTLVVISRI